MYSCVIFPNAARMDRCFALERLPFSSPSGHSVKAEWQTGYFDIAHGCTGPEGTKHFEFKAFKRLVIEEVTKEGHPLFESAKNRKVLLCAPQLFLRWAHHAGVPDAAASAISQKLLQAHSKHLAELKMAAFHGMDRLAWMQSLTIERGDLAHYDAMSNWTQNARSADGEVMAYCSIPVSKDAGKMDWLLTELIRPGMREAFAQHVRGSGCLLWEELVGDANQFVNVSCESMQKLVRSYTGPGALQLQAVFYNAKILEANNLGSYPECPQARPVDAFPIERESGTRALLGRLLERPEPFPVGWKEALMVVGGQNVSLFRASFAKRVRTNCSDSEYREDRGEMFTSVGGLKSLCKSCRGEKRRKLLEDFDTLSVQNHVDI